MLQKNSVWISIICHTLLIFYFLFSFQQKMTLDKGPDLAIPSYIYREISESPLETFSQQSHQNTRPINQEDITHSPLFSSFHSSQINHADKVYASRHIEEPVNLIGDKKINKPLLILLGKVLTARLFYPKTAVDFQIRGTTYIGFLLHPDGNITNIQLMKSSGAEVLDTVALNAVNAISPVKNVNQYINTPQHIIVGIIFG